MFKKIDYPLDRYAPWSYALLILGSVAFAAMVKLNLIDGAIGLAINVGLFGLGISGTLAWNKRSDGRRLRDAGIKKRRWPTEVFFGMSVVFVVAVVAASATRVIPPWVGIILVTALVWFGWLMVRAVKQMNQVVAKLEHERIYGVAPHEAALYDGAAKRVRRLGREVDEIVARADASGDASAKH